MAIRNFEEIIAWQKAEELSLLIYALFKSSRDYRFKDQIQSAAVSVMNNIAEGFERQSNKEFLRFLYIAKGSSGEVRSMSHLAVKLKYISEDDYKQIILLSRDISKMLYGLIQKLQKSYSSPCTLPLVPIL